MLNVRTNASGRLDDKGRLSLPSKLRMALDVARVPSLVLVSVGEALWALTPTDFSAIEARVAPSDPFAMGTLDFAHGVLSTADEVDIDRAGRIRVPPDLRALAGLDKDVRVFTVLDRLEIWDAGRWADRFAAARASVARSPGLPPMPAVGEAP